MIGSLSPKEIDKIKTYLAGDLPAEFGHVREGGGANIVVELVEIAQLLIGHTEALAQTVEAGDRLAGRLLRRIVGGRGQ